MKNLMFNFLQHSLNYNFELCLDLLEIKNFNRKYLQTKYELFFTGLSNNNNLMIEDKKILNITIAAIEKNHKRYNNVDLEIDVKLGKFQINYKSCVMKDLLDFFIIKKEKFNVILNLLFKLLNFKIILK